MSHGANCKDQSGGRVHACEPSSAARGGLSTAAYDGETEYFLDSDRSVLALRGDDGKQRWVGHAYDHAGVAFGYGGCAIAASLVVCNDSDLVAFRRVDGSRAWVFHPAVGRFPGYAGFVVSGASIFAGSPTGVVYGIDAATGEQRWAQTVLNTGNSNATGLSTDGQRVFVAFTHFVTPQRGGVMALDATNGAVQWTTDYPRPAPDQRLAL
jgi:outer membrane protein assembly factor BamB